MAGVSSEDQGQMIYTDTSCLMKLLLTEPESDEVRRFVAREDAVVVSSLAELEAKVQLKAGYLGGNLRTSQYREHLSKLARGFPLIHEGFESVGKVLVSTRRLVSGQIGSGSRFPS